MNYKKIFLCLWILSILFIGCYVAKVKDKSKPEIIYYHPRTGKALENVRVFRNWGVSDEEFIAFVHWMIDDTGYDDLEFREWQDLARRYQLKTAIVYYYKKLEVKNGR